MPCEPFDSSMIRPAGYDPAPCTSALAFRNHRSYRYWSVPPAEGMALEDAEPAGAAFAAHIRNVYERRHRVNLAGATNQQAAPR
jgi:hypothetical protein